MNFVRDPRLAKRRWLRLEKAREMVPIFEEMAQAGIWKRRAQVSWLNAHGHRTVTGREWSMQGFYNLLCIDDLFERETRHDSLIACDLLSDDDFRAWHEERGKLHLEAKRIGKALREAAERPRKAKELSEAEPKPRS